MKPLILFSIILFAVTSCNKNKGVAISEHPETMSSNSDTIVADFEMKGVSYVATNMPIDSSNISPLQLVNCNWIAQMPFAFCAQGSTNVQYDFNNQWWGETDEGVTVTAQLARADSIKTMLKPQLWISGSYTGAFTLNNNADWELWEDSYADFIYHFAHLADSLEIEMFCIGTELRLVVQERPLFFGELIDSIRTFYDGDLIYAANWDDYHEVPFWNKLDYIGIDGYFPLDEAITPSVADMVDAWQPIINDIDQIRIAEGKEVICTEFGYKNVNQTAHEPWNPVPTQINMQAQANAYQAFFEAFSGRSWFKGGFLWKWFPDYENSGGASDNNFTPQNKQAMKIIGKAF